jgi:hypothetical protein
MPESTGTDLVMRFELDNTPVYAECALDIADDDNLMKDGGFVAATYDEYSNFFQIENFDFSFSVKPDEGNSTPQPRGGTHPLTGGGGKSTGFNPPFAKWRSASSPQHAAALSRNYPFEVNSISFDRLIDRASVTFFDCCLKSRSFNKAVLIKRIARGHLGNKPRLPIGDMRAVFTDVLITQIDWDDGDMVKEKCEFICRAMSITYRQQKWDGSLGDPDGRSGLGNAVWKDDQAQSLRLLSDRRGR